MRVWEIREGFGLDHLTLAERPAPVCGPGQVLVQVAAASLNYRDLLMVEGRYNPRLRLPLIPVSDGVGRVAAVGEGVSRVRVGDRVAGAFAPGWIAGEPRYELVRGTLGGPVDGMLAEQVCLPEEGVMAVPDYLEDAEAATLPCAALTAWSALFGLGGLAPGDAVLIQGTGGVSIFALQLAVAAGARAIVTSSRDDKLERARALGARHTINYRADPAWGKTARELAGGEGVDVVIEVGGAQTFDESLRAVRLGGRIAVIGILSGHQKAIDLNRILMRQIRVQGVLVGHREGFEAMCRAFEAHRIRPVVDRVFPFDQARDALAYLARGEHFGKVSIAVA
jgi:NADPH:quinone reductase-like Zn-dependent oxidoreductase